MSEQLGSKEQNYTKTAETLNLMQQKANEGRGIAAIRDIVYFLERGEADVAKTTISGEWDKISSYPEIAEFLISEGLYTPIDFSKYF